MCSLLALDQTHQRLSRGPVIAHYPVVIVGAGMAGLGAARKLQELGFTDFKILEAQERAGGRIRTLTFEGQALELGAQWLHGRDSSLFRLAEKYDLLSEETSEEGLGVYIRDNGDIIDRELVNAVDFQIGNILGECEAFVRSADYPQSMGHFMSARFAQYLNERDDPADVKAIKWELFDWHVRFQMIDNSCVDLNALSARGWGEYVCVDDKAHNNLTGGYGRLVDILVDELPCESLFCSKPIISVECLPDSVRLQCRDGSIFSCDHLILTSSLGVLKHHLPISPPLPGQHAQAVEALGFHSIGKIFLIFEERWWEEDGFQLVWGRHSSEESWTRHIQGFDPVLGAPKVLLGWVSAEGVPLMEGLAEEDVGLHCAKLLRRFLPGRSVPDPIKVLRTTWASNEWVRGGYSHISTDCDATGSRMIHLADPVFVDGKMRILLAGEAVHDSSYSTTHGAFHSGEMQAVRLLSHMQKTCKSANKE